MANYTDPGIQYDLDSYSKVLLYFDGTDTSTTFTDESGKIWTPSGSAKLNVSNKKLGSACGSFDGVVGTYINTPDHLDFNTGITDYTIDFWFKTSATSGIIFYQGNSAGDALSVSHLIQLSSSKLLWSPDYNQYPSQNSLSSINNVNDNIWHHCACVRASHVHTLYIDGVRQSYVTLYGNYHASISYSITIGQLNTGGLAPYNGYIDQFRFSNGIGRWTTNFYITSLNHTDPGIQYDLDSYSKVLLRFDGANESPIFTDESGKIWTPSSNAKLNTANKRLGTACGSFDGGATTYITTPDHADFAMGSGDYTIDFWIKTNSLTAGQLLYQGDNGGTTSTIAFILNMTDTGVIHWYPIYNPYTTELDLTSGTLNDGVWHHIALVRFGAVFTLYVDGVSKSSGSKAGYVATDSSYSVRIAQNPTTPNHPLNGYLDQWRISKGVARWTANFSISQQSLSGNFTDPGLAYDLDDYTKVYIPFDGSNGSTIFTDQSGKIWTPFGTSQLNAVNARVGSACGVFDGVLGTHISTPATTADFNMYNGNYTIDFWMKTTATTGGLLYQGDNGGGAATVAHLFEISSSKMTWTPDFNRYPSHTSLFSINNINDGVWHHIAAVRNGNEFTFYVDGIYNASVTMSYTANSSSYNMFIGSIGNIHHYNGYVDNLRISKSIARWTSNFSISSPLPYRFKIIIDKTKVQGTNTNFPYLFSELAYGIPADFWTNVIYPNGLDIRFYDTDGITELDREIVLYDSLNEKVEAWVQIPLLSSSSNKEIWCSYGGIGKANNTSVWDDISYAGVWHLSNGTVINANDSTINANNGIVYNSPLAVSGKIDGSVDFGSSANSYIDLGTMSSLRPTTKATIESWVKLTSWTTSNYSVLLCQSGTSSPYGGYNIAIGNASDKRIVVGFNIEGSWINLNVYKTDSFLNAWHYIVGVYDGSKIYCYIDGVSAGSPITISGSIRYADITKSVCFSKNIGSSNACINAIIDEGRISSTDRSSDWILTQYNNQNNPETFSYVGDIATGWIQIQPTAAFSQRWSTSLVDFKAYFWLLGGRNESSCFSDIWRTEDSVTWQQVTPIGTYWSARSNHNTLVLNKILYVISGLTFSGTVCNDVWSTPDGINWTHINSSFTSPERCNGSVCIFNNKMWYLGGKNSSSCFSDVYNSNNGITWTHITTAPWSPRYSQACVVYDNKIWIIGGTNGIIDNNDTWWSSDGITWNLASASAIWTARANPFVGVLDGKLYLVGGNNFDGSTTFNDVYFSLDGVTWEQRIYAVDFTTRSWAIGLSNNEHLFVIAGQSKNDVWSDGAKKTIPTTLPPFSILNIDNIYPVRERYEINT